MTLPKPTIVIFDMDGTTVRHLNPRLLGLMERMDDAAFKLGQLWRWVFERKAQGPLLLEHDGDPERPIRKAKSIIVHRAIHKLRRKPVEMLVEPCPGIYAVLEFLKDNAIPTALVSNGLGKGYGEDILEKFALKDYFTVTVFREDILKSKPDPESLLLALQQVKPALEPTDVVWFIGDRHKDILAAQATAAQVPCKIVPIAYGMNAAVAVIKLGYTPDHIIMNYRDILALLKQVF